MKRRDFLKLSGSAIGITQLGPFGEMGNSRPNGRVLAYTPVYQFPDLAAPISAYYLPDSIQAMQNHNAEWVSVPDGYLPITALQPMLPAPKKALANDFPSYLEVIAPYAAVHQWAAVTAPIVQRLGHGAVILAQAILDQKWIELGPQAWIQSQRLGLPATIPAEKNIHAVLQGHDLLIWEGEQICAQVQVNRPSDLRPGNYPVQNRYPSQNREPYWGVPWNLELSSHLSLHGVYWHHSYGKSAPHLEIPLLPAKWLYHSLNYLTVR